MRGDLFSDRSGANGCGPFAVGMGDGTFVVGDFSVCAPSTEVGRGWG